MTDDWIDRAACRGKPLNWFHPEEGSRNGKLPPIARRALALCATCPVMDECLAHCLLTERFEFSIRADGEEPEEVAHWLSGIWGGTTEADRKATRHMAPEDRIRELRARSRTRALQLGLVGGR